MLKTPEQPNYQVAQRQSVSKRNFSSVIKQPKVSTQSSINFQEEELQQYSNFNNQQSTSNNQFENAQASDNQLLQPCPTCDRKFNSQSLAKHIKICNKVFNQKRKKFDVAQKRAPDGIEQVKQQPYQPKNQQMRGNEQKFKANAKQGLSKAEKKAKWKQESENFRNNLKAARLEKEGNHEEAALLSSKITAQQNSDLIPCPGCGRRFNEQAAARHIPLCQSKSKMQQNKSKFRK